MTVKQFLLNVLRKPFFYFLVAIFVFGYVTPVLAHYLGPDRTKTITTTKCNVILYKCEWIEAKGVYKYKQTNSWSCSLESKPWLSYPSNSPSCDASNSGYAYWDRDYTDSTSTQTFPPATINGTLENCNQQNGWCNTLPNLALSASEPVSGYSITNIEGTKNGTDFTCATGPNCNLTLSQGNNDFTYWAHSDFGDTTLLSSLNAKVDSVAPTINNTITGTLGTNGWFTSPVDITANASDATSGLASVQVSVDGGVWSPSASLSDGTYTLNCNAADNAGNVATLTNAIKVDTIAPSVDPQIPDAGSSGWIINGPVVLSSAGSDAGSGLASTQVSVDGGAWVDDAALSDGVHSVKFKSTDNAGNATTVTKEIKVDLTPASVSFSNVGTSGDAGWYVSRATTTIQAEDGTSGVDRVEFSKNNTAWQTGSSVVGHDGVNVIEAKVYDLAGNVSSASITVMVDTVSPSLAISTSGKEGSSGWYTSPATTTFIAADSASGVNRVEYNQNNNGWQTGTSVGSINGINTIDIKVYDNAGNISSYQTQVKVDTGLPTSKFIVPENAATDVPIQGVYSMSGSSSDALSGVEKVELSLDNGRTWAPLVVSPEDTWTYDFNTLAVPDGTYSIIVRTTDVAGNVNVAETSGDNTDATVTVVVNNGPPHIKLTPEWFIWEPGSLKITYDYVPFKYGSLTIADPQNRWPRIKIPFDEDYPTVVKWDRRFGDGTLAPIGNYRVTVVACNIYDLCSSKTATIKIPGISIFIPLPSATPFVESEKPAVEPTIENVPEQPVSPVIVAEQPSTPERQIPEKAVRVPIHIALSFVALIALMWAVASASLSDTRPRAINAITKTIYQKHNINVP